MKTKRALIVVTLFVTVTNAQLLCFYCEDCNNNIVAAQACGPHYPTMTPPERPDGTTPLPETTTVTLPVTTVPPETTTPDLGTTTTTEAPGTTTEEPATTPEPTTATPPATTTTVAPETTTPDLGTTTTTSAPETTTTTVVPDTTTEGGPTLPTSISPTLPTTITPTQSTGGEGSFVTPPITPLEPTTQGAALARSVVISTSPPARPDTYACIKIKTTVANREVVRRGCTIMADSKEKTCATATGGQYDECYVCMSHLCNV